MFDTLARLETIVAKRRIGDPALSYVAALTTKGRAKIAQKLGEEAVETVIAAVAGSRAEVISESADLLFHLAILLADMNVPLSDVMAELDAREGVSGLTEKASRSQSKG